jgi:aspartate-semialdehyde dehydrogenase
MTTLSIVGGDTLLGRELNERLSSADIADSIQLLGAGESTTLTEIEGEATVLTPLDADRLHASAIVFCAGDAAAARRVHEIATQTGGTPAIIDLTAGLEDLPNARLRSPLVETAEFAGGAGLVHIVAHPAASALALMLIRMHKTLPLRHAVVQVFEPASERGQDGLNELQQQVSSLLSFRQMDKRVFDAQLGFNMLPRYGEDAPQKLADIETRINRHLASLLEGSVPMPSIRLVQAPVFHGHSFSLWIEFETRPDVVLLEETLASANLEVRGADVEPPTNASAAGQSGVIAGVIEPDVNYSRAMWIWAVSDNYRVMADDAVEIARSLLGSSR